MKRLFVVEPLDGGGVLVRARRSGRILSREQLAGLLLLAQANAWQFVALGFVLGCGFAVVVAVVAFLIA